MFLVVTYDVRTVEERVGARRLRRVAKACSSYGIRVQKSVFEMQLGQKEWVELRARLLKEINPDEDSLRIYFLDQTCQNRVEHHGVSRPPNLVEDTLAI